MTINGNLVIGNGTTYTAAGYNLTVTGTTTIGGGASGKLVISSRSGTKIFNGLVTVNSGGSWTNTVNSTVTFRGGIKNNGNFIAGTGIQTFNTRAQTLSGTLSIPSLTITGVTVTNNGTLTIGTALAGTGGLTNGATGTLNLNFTGTVGITTLTVNTAGNTVNYGYNGTQTVRAVTYSNLVLSVSGAKTIATGTVVNGNLSISPTGAATANINAGLNIPVGSLTLGGISRINGTWGSTTASVATYHNDTFFSATTGYLTVATDTRATPTVITPPTASDITYTQALSALHTLRRQCNCTGNLCIRHTINGTGCRVL